MSTISRFARGASALAVAGSVATVGVDPFARFAGGASAYTSADSHSASPADPAAATTRSWDQLVDDLLALRQLQDDWDGQGADAPDPAVVDSALKLALDFRAAAKHPADRVVAGVNGTVFFEWFAPTEYLEIEVVSPGTAEGRWVYRETNRVEEFTLAR